MENSIEQCLYTPFVLLGLTAFMKWERKRGIDSLYRQYAEGRL